MFMMRTEVFIFSVCMVEVSQKKVYIVHRVLCKQKKRKTLKVTRLKRCRRLRVLVCMLFL